ncbi:MAG TPA: SMP-30/gluconolactonase/LRE family protein [Usitatibacter sp.]|nr:SMP-30/gluconolactonase/LRE family protein [Usitatibacter sp.]
MVQGRWAIPLLFFASAAAADPGHPATAASFSTLITTPLAIEGLTNDNAGNLYTPGRNAGAGVPCPVWRVPLDNPTLTVVGTVPAPSASGQCSPSGLAFGPDGMLYVTQSNGAIYRFTPDAGAPPMAELFASGVPGTNGLAFDWNGNLWTGDGTTNKGRVWRISPAGVVTQVFHVQPMANDAGVGRSAVTLPPGTAQGLVANGLQFDHAHNLYIADTARGAIWKVHVRQDGTPEAQVGCDTTFAGDTLCLGHVWLQHPSMEGADGIVLDEAGNVWVDANERNAVVFVANGARQATEVFRNPVDSATGLRNAGPLEFPTSPVLVGHELCTANSDGGRRDNAPNTAGEIPSSSALGKISCLDQRVTIPGMRLPVH